MGLLDWLTDGIGSSMGQDATGTGGMLPQTTPDMPPPPPGGAPPPMMPQAPPPPPTPPLDFQRPEFKPPSGPGDPMTSDIGAGMQPGTMPPPPPGVPLPAPRPQMPASPPPPTGAMPPPPPTGAVPGQPLSLAPGSPGASAPAPMDGQNPLQRSMGGGMDPNKMRGLLGAVAGGFKAAGNSAGKSPGQAFASGVGEGLEGGQKASDTGYDQRLKSLQLAVQAQKAGDTAAYNKNYAEYLKGKLESDTAKATPGAKSAWNKPDSQKFIDAQNALSKDPEVHASAKLLEQLSKSADEATIAKATATHNALIQQKQGMYLTGVGLNAQQIQQNMKTPPGSPENPHQVMSKQDFETYVKPGQAYKNPSDGKVYIRKGGGKGGDKEAPAAAAPPAAPAPPGPMPGTTAPEEE